MQMAGSPGIRRTLRGKSASCSGERELPQSIGIKENQGTWE